MKSGLFLWRGQSMSEERPGADPRVTVLLEYIEPYRNTLVFATFLMLGESVVFLLYPWLAGKFAESLLAPAASQFTYDRILLVWIAVLAIQGGLTFGNRYLISFTAEKILAGLRICLYDHIQALPLGYFNDSRRGEVLALMSNDANVLSQFVTGPLIGLLPQFLTLIGALVLMYLVNPFIALVIVVFIPLFFLAIKIIGRQIRFISRAIMNSYARTLAIVEENLEILPVIKSFTRQDIESRRFQESNRELLAQTSRYLKIQAMLSPVIHYLTALFIVALLWIISAQLETGKVTGGELVSLLFYGFLLTRPIGGLADLYGQIQRARGAMERLVDVFAIAEEPADEGREILDAVKGQIEFRNVDFSYKGRNKVLSNLDLLIDAGETVAITGKNGAGKSTMIHLLQRFYDLDQGNILIDGIDIANVSLTSLRNQIGLVPQQVLLLNGTVRENISFGKPDAGMEEIIEAARLARAQDFIRELPDGFDTVIGDQGIKLSGGQRQRLALARALIKDPPILVFDEATAMFDPEGEKSFIEHCKGLLQSRTVILITHRPETLALADRVVELKDGKIRE